MINHLTKKILCLLGGLTVASPTALVGSCVVSKGKPQIFLPVNHEIDIVLTSPVEHVIYSGFSFKNIKNFNRIKITNNFSLGLATFKAEIVNVNYQLKTFDVKMVCSNLVAPTQIQGGFTFWYDNNEIYETPTDYFLLKVSDTPKITLDSSASTSAVINLDKNGNGSCTFTGFEAYYVTDIESSLIVESTFEQVGTKIDLSIEFVNDKKFNINVSFSSAKADFLDGVFNFYNLKNKISDTPHNIFKIQLISQPVINAPKKVNYDVQLNGGIGRLIIPGFTFANIAKKDVSVEIIASGFESELTTSIVNWKEEYSTFDIQININTDTIHNYKIQFAFTNTQTGEIIPFTETTFWITSYGIVPNEAFDITENGGDVILNCIKSEWLDIIKHEKYTTLRIPANVTEIKDDAFNRIFTHDDYPNLTNLEFLVGSDLKTIGDSAFKGCNSFTNDLVLPFNIETVGSEAFFEDSFKSLTFSNLYQPITIGPDAFRSNKYYKGDLILPNDTNLVYPGAAFAGSWFDGTLYMPTKINDNFDLGSLPWISAIDMTRYDRKPSWIGKDYNFRMIGSFVITKPKYVYYSQDLVTDILEIKQDMIDHGLPAGDDEDPNNFIFKMVKN